MQESSIVLISHDSKDQQLATELKTFLEQIFTSADFYVSGRDLEGGQTWVEQIKNRLRSSKAIIALLTSRSLHNHWVYFESGAGFVDDKTIPLLTDGIKFKDLTPPLNLLQARTLSKEGIAELVKDVSTKLGLRRIPTIPDSGSSFLSKIEKLLRKDSTLELDRMMPAAYEFGAIKKWIYQENCVVYDFYVENTYAVAVDTYFLIDSTEIQLFGRQSATNYVLDKMIKSKDFLPLPLQNYQIRNNRLIYKSLSPEASIIEVARELTELLHSIQKYAGRK
jgi:hypothetical protein